MTEESRQFGREFRLALACIRWPLCNADREEIRGLTRQSIDWSWFTRILSCHQIVPLAYRNLRDAAPDSMPSEIAARLRQTAMYNARLALSQATELVRIAGQLQSAGVQVTTLKGVPLSILAFGSPAMRASLDIDLLISPVDVFEAERILFELGYERTSPKAQLTPKRRKYYLKYCKDFSYRSATTGLAIEVHWRLFRSASLPMQSMTDPPATTKVSIGFDELATLSGDDLFLYLCVHGALHAWALLKWIADLGALLNAMTDTDLRRLIARASNLGASAELAAALILVRRLMNIDRTTRELPDESNSSVRRIVKFSSEVLSSNGHCQSLDDMPPIRTFVYALFLRPSWSYVSEYLVNNAVFPEDWELVDLPDVLFPLYLGIRPFSWLLRRQIFRGVGVDQSKV